MGEGSDPVVKGATRLWSAAAVAALCLMPAGALLLAPAREVGLTLLERLLPNAVLGVARAAMADAILHALLEWGAAGAAALAAILVAARYRDSGAPALLAFFAALLGAGTASATHALLSLGLLAPAGAGRTLAASTWDASRLVIAALLALAIAITARANAARQGHGSLLLVTGLGVVCAAGVVATMKAFASAAESQGEPLRTVLRGLPVALLLLAGALLYVSRRRPMTTPVPRRPLGFALALLGAVELYATTGATPYLGAGFWGLPVLTAAAYACLALGLGAGRDDPLLLLRRRRSPTERARRAVAEGAVDPTTLALIADRTDNYVILTDVEGRIQWVNRSFERVTGFTLEEARGKRPGALLQGADTDPATVVYMHERLQRRLGFRVEILNYRKSGKPYWVALEVQPMHDEGGRVTHYMAVESDITERKRSEARFERAVRGSSDGLWEWDPATGSVWYSERFKELLGFGEPSAADSFAPTYAAWTERVHPDDRGAALETFQSHLESGQSCDLVYRLRTASGTFRWFHARGRAWRDEDGRRVRMSGSLTDVHERHEADEALARSRDLLCQTERIAEVGGWELMADASEPRWSEEVHRIHEVPLDYKPSVDEAFRFFPPQSRPVLHAAVEKAFDTGHGWDLELPFVTAQGNPRWVRTVGKAEVRGGRTIRLWGTIQDITRRKEAERERESMLCALANAKELAEEHAREIEKARVASDMANRAKSEFLANMSHEIRTPMTAILGYTEFLQETKALGAEARESLRIIRENGDHLMGMLDDLIDISRIEAGDLNVVRAATPALAAAEQVLDLVRQRAGAKGIDLRLITTSTLPATIETDANRLRQILINLVGNGIKFTDAGEVRLEVGLFRTDGRTRLSFAVVDTGVGMPPEVTSRLFETFSQADASMTRRFGGTGLGLAIAQRLATRLGGEITVESVLGEGSRFTLTIDPGPIDERTLRSCGATGSVATTDTGAASLALSGHVLLVEDNAVNQKLALAILARSGLEVDVVSNGSEAVEQALAAGSDGRPYDLIILDMQMPVMDGYTAARTLRGAGYTQPILALTAHAMADDRERCLACGCDDYATKPFDRAKLLSAVARNLNPAPRSLAL